MTYFFNQMLRLERKMQFSVLSPEQFGVKHQKEKSQQGNYYTCHYDKEQKGAKIKCILQKLVCLSTHT